MEMKLIFEQVHTITEKVSSDKYMSTLLLLSSSCNFQLNKITSLEGSNEYIN